MLALWSRATQNPGSCRCIVCGSRTVHNGSRSSLRHRTSTIVHTTTPAAGIAIDAQARQSGRLWEEAIESLKEALERPLARPLKTRGQANVEHESVDHIPLERLPRDLDWTRLSQVAGMDLADDQRLFHRMHSRAYDDPHGTWDELRWDSRFPGMQQLQWPANTGHRVKPYNLPPQSLWAPDMVRLAAMRRRHTWKKLTMQELCTAVLIYSLLRRVRVPWQPQSGLSPQIERVAAFDDTQAWKARKEILANIVRLHLVPGDAVGDEALEAQIYPDQPAIPRYHQDPDGDFYETTQRLNSGLKELLRHDTRGRKEDRIAADALAKICHNLFVSSAPPDVQTFNILIAGFKRWRRPEMVDDVILAFHASKIRPNEITLRYILGHYISERRPDGFSRFVAWMRGVGDALMLADPDVTINEASQGRLMPINEKKIYQKVYPTPMVFGALIGGVVKFGGFDRALEVYYEMKADGWGLDMAGLTRLLGDCIRRADWQGGVYVWDEINSIKDMAMPKDMAKAYEFMLSLCSVTGNTSAFNQVLKEVANRGFDRQNIISNALRTTQWAQAKKANLAPAWAADNLLIAVSSFVKDLKEPEPGATPEFSIDDLMYGAPVVEGDSDMPVDNLSDWEDSIPTEVSEQRPTDLNKTWASWVEAEFGERPKDPDAHDWLAATTSKPVKDEPNPTASKEVWETWLEAEFGEKPKDPES
ncbi:hypothetical protein BU25DRAFT_406415 [Macroventuria anomochaeta]|uniref:Uncharacterized protein n=1 Tax=Macroventuria anomochaeta TaxID=301207 RepID=A0ACB6SEX1_9PLEO|nr:uncharacterized protein BU25DRAFT_406415 [Macroventuria anomochaeta]KAF2631883.1 hypothetical protein BU25DRAFT_406415 [Macroventuria anomochaeta]